MEDDDKTARGDEEEIFLLGYMNTWLICFRHVCITPF